MEHIGNAIKNELKKKQRSVSWLARNLYCDRTNIYDIFKRKSIDTELLYRISIILNHNFFSYLYSETDKELNDIDCNVE
ncbi:MAG: XRE family transcriptional regulator [Bacteroidales bacterium]|nr:XRE family transcriptional regulator [Bacteroidales bacterium]MBQ7819332.1 XRE family transcriptional regulator [Bacteroidales bacterium]